MSLLNICCIFVKCFIIGTVAWNSPKSICFYRCHSQTHIVRVRCCACFRFVFTDFANNLCNKWAGYDSNSNTPCIPCIYWKQRIFIITANWNDSVLGNNIMITCALSIYIFVSLSRSYHIPVFFAFASPVCPRFRLFHSFDAWIFWLITVARPWIRTHTAWDCV